MVAATGRLDRTGRGMSEGGRKVWNREQLLALNDGAVVLGPGFLGRIEPVRICHIRTRAGTTTVFELFGDEYGTSEPTEYPIDVIWEPTE